MCGGVFSSSALQLGVGFPFLQGSAAPLLCFYTQLLFSTSKAPFYCFLWPRINTVTQSCCRSVCVCVDTLQALYPPVCLSTCICVWLSHFLNSGPHQNRPCSRARQRMLMKPYTARRVITHKHSLRAYSAVHLFLGHKPLLYKWGWK